MIYRIVRSNYKNLPYLLEKFEYDYSLNSDIDNGIRLYFKEILEKNLAVMTGELAFDISMVDENIISKEEVLRIAIDSIMEYAKESSSVIYIIVKRPSFGMPFMAESKVELPQMDVPQAEVPSIAAAKSDKTPRGLFGRLGAKKATGVRDECKAEATVFEEDADISFDEKHEDMLKERIKHISDSFSEYLLYLIASKNMENAEVYKRAIVDKKVFSKIKNNPDYHPQKITALCLCIGAKLNLDETRDLLARAGYALSPSDITDIIFKFFIENEIYDMIELDIQLEEHGQPCIIA